MDDYRLAASGRGLHDHRVLYVQSVPTDVFTDVPDGRASAVGMSAGSGVGGGRSGVHGGGRDSQSVVPGEIAGGDIL